MKKNWLLFKIFFKASAFTFSGGLAMLPIIQKEIVDKNNLLSEEELLQYASLANSIPGPIVLDLALFVGKSVSGYMGMLLCTLAVSLPAFIGMLVVAIIFKSIPQDNDQINGAFNAIQAASAALIFSVCISSYKKTVKNSFHILILAIMVIGIFIFKINSILLLAICGLLGVLDVYIKARRGGNDHDVV